MSLWWLSFANAERCGGVAIVEVRGERQTQETALLAAMLQKVTPDGEDQLGWEVGAFQIPEDERAKHEPYAGRLLTPEEAEAAFEAKSLGAWESEYPEAVKALCDP